MAYRRTVNVKARLEAKREMIMEIASSMIAQHGVDNITSDAVARKAGIAVGSFYLHFADIKELFATIVANTLQRHLTAMAHIELAASGRPAVALERGILCLLQSISAEFPLMTSVSRDPVYREGIQAALARMLRLVTDEHAVTLSRMAYGAIFEVARSRSPRIDEILTACLLRGFGIRRSVSA